MNNEFVIWSVVIVKCTLLYLGSTYVWHLPNTSLLLILIIIRLAFILRFMPAAIIHKRGRMVDYYNFISVGKNTWDFGKKKLEIY